jgi:hypothetical protein
MRSLRPPSRHPLEPLVEIRISLVTQAGLVTDFREIGLRGSHGPSLGGPMEGVAMADLPG